MVRYGMLIEVDRCIGCDTCLQACKDEFVGNDHLPYSAAQPETAYGYGPNLSLGWPDTPSTVTPWVTHGHLWIDVQEKTCGRHRDVKVRYIPTPCMHCDDPPCIKASTNRSVYRRLDGIIIIDPRKSRNQTQIVDSCPYGKIFLNHGSMIPQKCTFCAHLIDRGNQPRCVEACPLGVITFGDLNDPQSEVSKKIVVLKAEPLHPEYETKAKVYYSGL